MERVVRAQPLIAVPDVEASGSWYRRLLRAESGHGGPDYERIVVRGEIVLQIHRWDAHDHPHFGDAAVKPYGNGVLLWFQVAEFDALIGRARDLNAEILEAPHVNPSAGHRECWLRDPDGYVVVVASAYGDLGE